MSKLAEKIATTPAPPVMFERRGPENCCFPLYGAGDLEDWEQVEALRTTPDERGQRRSWRQVQDHIDGLVGIEHRLPLEKFRYHLATKVCVLA